MSRGMISTAVLLAGAVVLAQPAQGQETSSARLRTSELISMRPAGPDDIIVTAPARATPQQVEHQARAISQVDGSVWATSMARINARVCPGIMGLGQDMAELMVDRIRYNAERIGLARASENGCLPNIIVVFSANGQAELKTLARTEGYLFKDMPKAEMDALLADPAPVHVWLKRVTRSRFGDQMVGNHDNFNQPPTVAVQNSHSHIWFATRQDIESSVLVIDIKAIDGLSIDQIADYVTMRSFARTRPPSGSAAADTILNLFDPDNRHSGELTPFDMAYLKSLYGSYDSAKAMAVIGATRREMQKMPKPDGAGEPAAQP